MAGNERSEAGPLIPELTSPSRFAQDLNTPGAGGALVANLLVPKAAVSKVHRGDGHRHTFIVRPQPNARKAKGGRPSDRFELRGDCCRGWGTEVVAEGAKL